MSELVKVCSWCPHAREVTALFEASGQLVTHALCPSCQRRAFGDLEVEPETEDQ